MYIPALALEKELHIPGFADYERGQLVDCRWSSCGTFIAGTTFSQCGGENTAIVWEYDTAELMKSFMDEIEVLEVAWAPGKPTLAMICYDYSHQDRSRVRFYNVPGNRMDAVTPAIKGVTFTAVPSWSCDSRYLALSGCNSEITVISSDNGAIVYHIPHDGSGCFLWNPCRLIGALCSADGIYILDFENGPAQIRRISVPGSPALAVWAPSGDFLASLSINGEVSIQDSRDGSLIWQYGELFPLCKENSSVHVPPPVSLMAWSPCGRELFVSVGGREVLVISTERHLLSARLKCLNNAVSMAISHDGEWCAVRSEAPYGENGQVEIWRRGEWHRPFLKPLSGDSVKYREHGRALEFHPEKPLIASFNNGSWHVNVWRVGNRI